MNPVSCILCRRSEETEVTGALSSKQEVTAHQNCLLFSSGIFCESSPEYDELFGFAVRNVLVEYQRGRRLTCHHCKKSGATAGCEIRKCKKSFHYPCAFERGARIVEDHEKGKYGIYCPDHKELINGKSVNGDVKPHSSKTPSVCRASKKSKTNGDASEAGPSSPGRHSWSGFPTTSQKRRFTPSNELKFMGTFSCHLVKKMRKISQKKSETPNQNPVEHQHRDSERQDLSRDEEEEEEVVNLSQVRHKRSRILMSDDSSDSTGDGLIAPIGSDESLNSAPEEQSPEPQPTSSVPQTPFETENHIDKNGGCEDDDKTISDAESESLLSRVMTSSRRQSCSENAQFSVAVQTIKKECEEFSIQVDHFARPEVEDVGGSVLQNSYSDYAPIPPHSSPRSVYAPSFAPSTVDQDGGALPAPTSATLPPPLSPPPPNKEPTNKEPTNDSAGFWRKCNAAKCTQDIFNDFIRWLNILSSRIQADEASQEECERALSVMKASGQLENIVATQQKDLQRRLTELQAATAAMEEVVSALR
ncbi:hypothetical protein OJAV_G00207540 [Oryzias javanicus]|uniref:PHD-type domain-containing protein n=1 Tax=Oryzias javanicus TaxID=123683 RepID=A0A437C6L9_ORYJA|nr:hypothetical protein OJAV_G00207540 [Oryzias javanicus]